MTDITVPCIKLPEVDIPSVSLVAGAELKGFVDISLGAATPCKLTFNLLLQIAPLLASMACLLKIITAVTSLLAAVQDMPNPSKLSEAVTAVSELAKCIPGPDFAFMIKGILQIVVNFLFCFADNLEQLLKFQATIDLSGTEDNPVLRATLICAQDNAKASVGNLMQALQPLNPILKAIQPLMAPAGLSIDLTDLNNLTAGGSAGISVDAVKQVAEKLQVATG
jgi:hypothetical protein